jgi:hypothetical protein
MHPKGDRVWTEDSVGGTPTEAVETTALPGKPAMIGVKSGLTKLETRIE